MPKNWMGKLKIKKGALRSWLKTPAGKKIPMAELTALKKKPVGSKTKYGTMTATRKKQVVLAITFKKSNRKGAKRKVKRGRRMRR